MTNYYLFLSLPPFLMISRMKIKQILKSDIWRWTSQMSTIKHAATTWKETTEVKLVFTFCHDASSAPHLTAGLPSPQPQCQSPSERPGWNHKHWLLWLPCRCPLRSQHLGPKRRMQCYLWWNMKTALAPEKEVEKHNNKWNKWKHSSSVRRFNTDSLPGWQFQCDFWASRDLDLWCHDHQCWWNLEKRGLFKRWLNEHFTHSCSLQSKSQSLYRLISGRCILLSPASGSYSLSRSETRDDFPDPLDPTTAMMVPAGTVRLRFWKIGVSLRVG